MTDAVKYVAFKGKLLNLDLLKEVEPTVANLSTLHEVHLQLKAVYERWNLTPAQLESLLVRMQSEK